jgi:polar amino acid transport system substrate-binding protein
LKRIYIFVLFLFSMSAIAEEKLVFATHSRAPLSLYLKEVIQEALKPYSIQAEVLELPGSRVILQVNNGRIDGDLSRVENFKDISDYPSSNYRRVDEAIVLTEIVMITLAQKEIVQPLTWNTVNQGTAAFLRGSKTIRKHLDSKNRVSLSSNIQALEMVANERADSAIMFASVAKSLFQQHAKLNEKLIIQKNALMSYPLFIYLNKKHLKLIPKLEQSLRQLKASGFIENTAKRYQLIPPNINPE